jgi:hypothetical protein
MDIGLTVDQELRPTRFDSGQTYQMMTTLKQMPAPNFGVVA